MKVSWVRSICLVLVAVVVGSVPQSVAAQEPDWQAVVSAVPATRYSVAAAALVERAAGTPEATDTVGKATAGSLADHTTDTFFDGVRVVDEYAGKELFQDLQQFSSWTASRLGSAPSANLSTAMVDALTAARQVADTAVQDAASALQQSAAVTPATVSASEESQLASRVESGSDLVGAVDIAPDTRSAATTDLQRAREMLGRADDACRRGLPVSAAVHDGLAWKLAFGAIRQLGITYDGDRDADGVTDVVELRLGASPLTADTDGDGLSDSVEVQMLGWLSVSDADSDDDLVRDGDEDLDEDGLINRREVGNGSSPSDPDGDRDGLDDSEELEHGTRHDRADTDADTLLDGVELRLGTSPITADTDGDGIRDDAETLSTTVDGPAGVSAVLTGTGDLVTSFRAIEADEAPSAASGLGQVSPAYDFSLSEPARERLAQARITLPFQPGEVSGDPQDFRLFWFDPALQLWQPEGANQQVDVSAGTVTATVTHFSLYAIFDIRNWQQTWTAQDDPCHRRTGGGTDVVLLDLSLILDSSGSMAWNDPQGLRRTAAKSFVDALLPEDRAAVVDFDSRAMVRQGLTTDKADVKAAIDRIDSSGGTNIAERASAGTSLLVNNGDPERARIAILLTDGEGYYDPALTVTAKANGIVIYTIGLGPSVDAPLLRSIAQDTGGVYNQVATADELPEVFRRLSEETGDDPLTKVDTDLDGLDDCTEIKGALGTTGQRYVTDPGQADTDGDGIPDGAEISLEFSWSDLPPRPGAPVVEAPRTYTVFSDPTRVDTDGDGVDDGREGDLDTQPRWSDTDFDGLSDGSEIDDYVTNPLSSNSDGDDWGDAYEVTRADEGLDPQRPDTVLSAWDYVSHFLIGYVCGDFWPHDTIPWLAGYLAATATSFIPVVGWIIGTVTDLRDVLAHAIRSDWVGAGLSLLSVVPYVGDVLAIGGKVVKFLAKVPRHFDDAVRLIARWDKLSEEARTGVLKVILLGAHADLRTVGLSDSTILKLAKSDRNDLRALAAAARSTRRISGPQIPFQRGAAAGERAIRDLLGDASTKAERQFGRGLLDNARSYREYDSIEDLGTGFRGHEVKTGSPRYGNEVGQCERDGALLRTAASQLSQVVWHFVGHSRYGSMSVSSELLGCLERNGISFVIHAE